MAGGRRVTPDHGSAKAAARLAGSVARAARPHRRAGMLLACGILPRHGPALCLGVVADGTEREPEPRSAAVLHKVPSHF